MLGSGHYQDVNYEAEPDLLGRKDAGNENFLVTRKSEDLVNNGENNEAYHLLFHQLASRQVNIVIVIISAPCSETNVLL